MFSSNRRQNRRATVNLLVSEINRGKLFVPLLADVSEEGVLIESPVGLDMPRDHAPVVELMLPGVPEVIYARCQVLRESEHGFFKKRALKFVDISAHHRKHLRLYIQQMCGIC